MGVWVWGGCEGVQGAQRVCAGGDVRGRLEGARGERQTGGGDGQECTVVCWDEQVWGGVKMRAVMDPNTLCRRQEADGLTSPKTARSPPPTHTPHALEHATRTLHVTCVRAPGCARHAGHSRAAWPPRPSPGGTRRPRGQSPAGRPGAGRWWTCRATCGEQWCNAGLAVENAGWGEYWCCWCRDAGCR